MSPLSNSYVRAEDLRSMEAFYPLKAYVCERCFLVQLEEFEQAEAIFTADYAYHSSYSTTWLEHARRYAEQMTESLRLGSADKVVELASNDGYLLQHFVERGVPVLGVEPARGVADVAQKKGIPTEVAFFGRQTAERLARAGLADLMVANNVLPHVPDLNDFVAGTKLLLSPRGVVTMEFPHLMRLIDERQFDTIYHEHFSYFSLLTVTEVFKAHGLVVFDVEELTTHGGSLRVHVRHEEDSSKPPSDRVFDLHEREQQAGYRSLETYRAFARALPEEKRDILELLINEKRAGHSIAAYGAPAKGNTLLNYCGVGTDFVEFTADRNPVKQGTWLPGSRIPVLAPEALAEARPDLVWILPWNLKDEIMDQLSFVREWGGRFLARAPELGIHR